MLYLFSYLWTICANNNFLEIFKIGKAKLSKNHQETKMKYQYFIWKSYRLFVELVSTTLLQTIIIF